MEKYGRAREATDGSIIRRMRIACCITKAQDTHSEYVIPVPFPRQQWLPESASVLRHTYIVCVFVELQITLPGYGHNDRICSTEC